MLKPTCLFCEIDKFKDNRFSYYESVRDLNIARAKAKLDLNLNVWKGSV